MKINSFQKNNVYNLNNKKEVSDKDSSKSNVAKNVEQTGKVAFYGLIKKKPIDATFLSSLVEMASGQEYTVLPESAFLLGQHIFYLDDKNVKDSIDCLFPNEKFYIGRQTLGLKGDGNSVADNHLCIRKGKNGQLYASLVNKNYSAKILPNVVIPETLQKPFKCEPNLYYEIPIYSALKLGNVVIDLANHKDKISSMQDGEKLLVGRATDADIKIADDSVSRKHCVIEKKSGRYYVKDLQSLNGTSFEKLTHPSYVNAGQEIYTLQKGVETKVPRNSQLYLGGDFVIDLRNKNILELLSYGIPVLVGRSKSADLVVPETYPKVSRNHLNLLMRNNEIYVTDIASTNDTKVIPKEKIRPFYGGVENIEFSQGNIGDCYLLANLYSLSRNYVGRFYLENMVKVDDNGNYIVQFHNHEPISVPLEQLDGQKIGYEEKRCVSGDLAIRAIERAYGKMLNSEVDYGKTLFRKIDDGGHIENALYDLTGIKGDFYRVSDIDLEKTLSKLGPNLMDENLFLCSTPSNVKYDKYADKQHRFIRRHAYAIKNIDLNKKLIEIVNPHNTKATQVVSFCEFSEIFDYLHVVEM